MLLCDAEGLPTPTVQWYKGNRAIGDLSEKIYYVPTTTPHTTVYTCVSRNKAGGEIRTVKMNITVIVQCKRLKFLFLIVMILIFIHLVPPQPCPQISPPENGSVFFLNNRQNAIFYCIPCYFIQGPPILACKGGKWNLPPPKCVKVC